MEKVILTIARIYANGSDDYSQAIEAIGYDGKNVQEKASSRYAACCTCTNFGLPEYCKPGRKAEYFKAEGILLEDADMSVGDEIDGEEIVEILKYENARYALFERYYEWYEGGSLYF